MNMSKLNQIVCGMIAAQQKVAEVEGMKLSIIAANPVSIRTSNYGGE